MGLPFSVLNKFGLPWLTAAATGQVYDQHFKDEDIKTFPEFHIAYVEFCKYFNTILPGQDFETPSREEIKEFYEKTWHIENDAVKKKEQFIAHMRKTVKEAEVNDRVFIMAGLAAPAAAIMVKRSSENIPQVKKLKLQYVPNVVFVPLCTLFAIMGATAVQVSKVGKKG